MCALQNGESIATTMTFSPLDGLPMGTRCGSIDAGAVLYMASELKMTPEAISEILNTKSGLLGLSGVSRDIRTLLNDTSEGAAFALEFYAYRICRELGALVSTLKGIDALVFTGGAGAYSWQIRGKICQELSWLDIYLDEEANKNNATVINNSSSRVSVFAIKTDEEILVAKLATGLELNSLI
jgi:acetate kinase